MMTRRVLLVMLTAFGAAWLAAPARLGGQQVASPPAMSDTTCTYLRCSLWLDRGRLVRGADANEVARRGFLRPMRILPFVAGDSARHHAALYEGRARRASRLSLAAAALVTAGYVVGIASDCDPIASPIGDICRDDSAGPIMAGLVIGGLTLDIVATTISVRGRRSLVRALWWHNSQFAR